MNNENSIETLDSILGTKKEVIKLKEATLLHDILYMTEQLRTKNTTGSSTIQYNSGVRSSQEFS